MNDSDMAVTLRSATDGGDSGCDADEAGDNTVSAKGLREAV
jgi:hypothetical protein